MMISLVANFYKSERYIPKLIKSVLAQTYTDWELICVNDCSPGNDLAILTRYAEKDTRIRIINNIVNLGICKAKYIGIQEAKGEYLCFIDGDDWLEPDALQRMIEPAEKYNLDMVVMNHKKVLPVIGYSKPYRSSGVDYEVNIELNPSADEGTEMRKNFEKYYSNWFGCGKFMVTYWGKLIRKKLIEDSGFTPPNEYVGEDFVFTMTIFPYIRRMMFVDYIGYNWRWGGLTSGKKNNVWTGEKNIRRSNEIYKDRLNLLQKYHMEEYLIPLMIEQRNNFEGYIGNEARSNAESEYGKKVITILKDVLSSGFYRDFLKLKSNSQYTNDVLLDCIVNQDAKGVYEYCREIYKRTAASRSFRALLHKALYPLAKI